MLEVLQRGIMECVHRRRHRLRWQLCFDLNRQRLDPGGGLLHAAVEKPTPTGARDWIISSIAYHTPSAR